MVRHGGGHYISSNNSSHTSHPSNTPTHRNASTLRQVRERRLEKADSGSVNRTAIINWQRKRRLDQADNASYSDKINTQAQNWLRKRAEEISRNHGYGGSGRGRSRRGTENQTNAPRNPEQDNDKPSLPPAGKMQFAKVDGVYYPASVYKDGKWYTSVGGKLYETTTTSSQLYAFPNDAATLRFGKADSIVPSNYVQANLVASEGQKLYPPGGATDNWHYDPITREQKESNNNIWAGLTDKQKGEVLYRQGLISTGHELLSKGGWGGVMWVLEILPSFGMPSGEYSDRDPTIAKRDSLRPNTPFEDADEQNGVFEHAQIRPISFIVGFFKSIWNTAEKEYEKATEPVSETMEEIRPADDASIAAGQGGGGEFNPRVRSIFGKELSEDDYIEFYQKYVKNAASKPRYNAKPELQGMSEEDIIEILKGREGTRFVDFMDNPQALTAFLSGKSEELIREKVMKDWSMEAYPVNVVEVYGKDGKLINRTEFDAIVGYKDPTGVLKIYPDTDLSNVVIFDGKMGKKPVLTEAQRELWPILASQGAQIEVLREYDKLDKEDKEWLRAHPEILYNSNFTLDSQFKASKPD